MSSEEEFKDFDENSFDESNVNESNINDVDVIDSDDEFNEFHDNDNIIDNDYDLNDLNDLNNFDNLNESNFSDFHSHFNDLLVELPERQVNNDNQVLITNSSKDMLDYLITQTNQNQSLNNLNTSLSYTKRQYLKVIGKPINLDDLSKVKLPPLKLNLKSNEFPNTHDKDSTNNSFSNYENKPINNVNNINIDEIKVKVDEIDLSTLNLLSLKKLQSIHENLSNDQLMVNELLTKNLELLDTLKNDKLVYNNLISDLISQTNSRLSNNKPSMKQSIKPKPFNLFERVGPAGLWQPNSLPATPPERVRSPLPSLSGNRVNY